MVIFNFSIFFFSRLLFPDVVLQEKNGSGGTIGYTQWAKQADWSGRRTAFIFCCAGRDGCLPLTCLFL